MKVDLTDLSPVKKKMQVEVPVEEVQAETRGVLSGYRNKARIPGFRPGKAPLKVIQQRFAKEVHDDVRDRLVWRSFTEAAKDKGLRPLGEPQLEDLVYEEGKPLSYTTTFEVVPEIALQGYQGIELRRGSTRVDPAEVDAELERQRQARMRFVSEEGRESAQGDLVVADVEGTPQDGESFRREKMQILVGQPDNVPAFNEHLVGVKAGAELTFSVDYPQDYPGRDLAGKRVDFRAEVHEVKRPELPELDDEFAKDLGDFDGLQALKTRIAESLAGRKKYETESALRQSLMDKVLLQNPMLLPEVLVDGEIRRRMEDLVRQMYAQGLDPEKAEVDWVDVRKRQEEPARKSVHARLILDAVARAEGIAVDAQAVDERIARESARIGESPKTLKSRLKEQGGLEAFKTQLVRERSLDNLLAVANIQNEE